MKSYKPVSAGLRHRIIVNKSKLWKGGPIKALSYGKVKSGGRNNSGKITTYHRGGGHKQKYRIIDFKRHSNELQQSAICGKVLRIEYDPNRTAFIALILEQIKNENETLYRYSYILAPTDVKVGDIVESGLYASLKIGNSLPLYRIPVGTYIHNIEMRPGKGGQLIRAAGCGAKLLKLAKTGYVLIKLPSSKYRYIDSRCYATLGYVSNEDHFNRYLGKAGVSRWLGIRPTVRGTAMNPIDHPHGGGAGRTAPGRPSVTPWARHTKGAKTRRLKLTDKYITNFKT